MPTDPTPARDPRGGPRYGHTPRKSNTGVRGVSEVRRAGRSPQFSVQWRDAAGCMRSAAFTFTDANRHVVLSQAAAHFHQHHVPAEPPPQAGR